MQHCNRAANACIAPLSMFSPLLMCCLALETSQCIKIQNNQGALSAAVLLCTAVAGSFRGPPQNSPPHVFCWPCSSQNNETVLLCAAIAGGYRGRGPPRGSFKRGGGPPMGMMGPPGGSRGPPAAGMMGPPAGPGLKQRFSMQ
eukprot:1160257-Pelagomonas_calceolata.AAC.2